MNVFFWALMPVRKGREKQKNILYQIVPDQMWQIYDWVCANCARVCRALNEKRGGGGSESWQEVCAIKPLSAQIFFLKKEKTFKVDCGNYVHIFDPVQLVASDITIFAQIEKCKYWDYNNFCCNYIKLIIHIHLIYRKPINMTHFVKTTNSTKKTKSFGSSKFQINLSPLLVLNVVWIFAAINVSAFCMQSLFFMVTLTVLKTWLSFRF